MKTRETEFFLVKFNTNFALIQGNYEGLTVFVSDMIKETLRSFVHLFFSQNINSLLKRLLEYSTTLMFTVLLFVWDLSFELLIIFS